MKRAIFAAIFIFVLLIGAFILARYKSKNVVTIKYENNGKTYEARFKLPTDHMTYESDKAQSNSVTIKNEKEKYELDLSIDLKPTEEYEEYQNASKENNKLYTNSKFGKYDGTIVSDDLEVWGTILLDTSDSNSRKFITYYLSSTNPDNDAVEIQELFKSSNIQNILNNIEYKKK